MPPPRTGAVYNKVKPSLLDLLAKDRLRSGGNGKYYLDKQIERMSRLACTACDVIFGTAIGWLGEDRRGLVIFN